jgi:hypothetical protein
LVVSVFLELLLHRIGTHLLVTASTRDELPQRIVERGGLFFFYFTGFLALGLFTWGTVVIIRDRNLLRLPDRMSFTFLAALFLPLAAAGLLFGLPKAVAPHLNTTFGFLLLVLVVGFVRKPAPLRAKLGVLYLCAPLLLHVFWLLTQQIPSLAPSGSHSELPTQLFEIGEHLVVVGAFAVFLFFAPLPRRATLFSPIPVTLAALVTAGVALFIRYQYPDAVQAAYHGLRLNIPPPSLEVLMHLSALFSFVLTVCALLARPDPERSAAFGLLLVGLSGFQLELPHQLLLTLLGMVVLMRGAMEAGHAEHAAGRDGPQRDCADGAVPPTSAGWSTYLSRLAAASAKPGGAGEAVQLQHGGRQIAHLRGRREGLSFALRIVHRGGLVEELEATVGEPPRESAPIALHRRRGSRGRRVTRWAQGPRVRLGAPDLDRELVLRDSTGTAAAVLSDGEMQANLLLLVHGWLGLWPGAGVRYVAHPGRDGWPIPIAEVAFSPEMASTEEVEALVALLESLARRIGVRAEPPA